MTHNTRWLIPFVAFGLVVALSGCGQKGDLYLPDSEPAAEQPDEDEDEES